MSPRAASGGASVALRTLLAVTGTVAATAYAAWPVATGCFAGLAFLSMHIARTAERREMSWRRMARRDPLTGVGNYRRLHERLTETVAAEPQRFALLTMDVDRFKEINETYGHLEGDRLLREVGQALLDNVRGDDIVARQGGDEFSVLAPGTDEEGARLLAERIEHALERIELADDQVRASIGIAIYPIDGTTAVDLLTSADDALRRTKLTRRSTPLAA